MASSLSSALSSMEVMLDALMQRGIGKPEEKPKEEAPPALPTRPIVRGRLPSLHKPGAPPPWIHLPPLPPSPLPTPQEEEEDKLLVNLELERRAVKAEEEAMQKDEEANRREEEIAALRQQVEHYESRLSECEVRMKSVEEELLKQITALQTAQSAAVGMTGGSSSTRHRREKSCDGVGAAGQSPAARAEKASTSRPLGNEPAADERQTEVNRLAKEFRHQSQAFEHGARAVAGEAKPSTRSVDELKKLKRQFGAWRKEYEARLRKTKAELKKLVHKEKNHRHGHGQPSRCSWWRRIKKPQCKRPKCCTCTIKLWSPRSCRFSCCFRRCC